MIFYFLVIILSVAYGDVPLHWNHMTEIRDRHEFYNNNEMIVKPKNSWQTLFSVVYVDMEMNYFKDCVFFKVPGVDAGVLKVKAISVSDECESYLLSSGDKEWRDIRSLQFFTDTNRMSIDMTFPKFQSEKWVVDFLNKFSAPLPAMHLSSADYKTQKLILLAPRKLGSPVDKNAFLKDGTLCHAVNDDCEEVKPSICSQCSEGWYEIPNGCLKGPKYCGRMNCGGKGLPACRRGMKWQREEKNFDCRTDSSFAYCSIGLSVQCQGRLAYCR